MSDITAEKSAPEKKNEPDSLTLSRRFWMLAAFLMFLFGFFAMFAGGQSTNPIQSLQAQTWTGIWFQGGFIFTGVAGIIGAIRAHKKAE